jgi:autotransporter-associated beta strand protein
MRPRYFLIPSLALLLNGEVGGQIATWTNANGGNWNTPANWGGTLPSWAADLTVDFSTLNITANRELQLTTTGKTVGKIKFGDTTPTHQWDIVAGGGPLTLSTTTGQPVIEAVNTVSVITVGLGGTQGFEKTGPGTIRLNNQSNPITGEILVSEGVLQIRDGSATNPGLVFAAATMNDRSIRVTGAGVLDLWRNAGSTTTWSLPATALESGGTLRFRAAAGVTGTLNHNMAAALTVGTGGGTILNSVGTGAQNITLSGAISGSGPLSFQAQDGGSNTRRLAISSADNSYSGNWSVAHASTGIALLHADAANALGTGTVTLGQNGRLLSGVNGSLASLTGVTVNHSAAVFDLAGHDWQNTGAALTVNAGTVNVGSGLLSVGSVVTTGGEIKITSSAAGTARVVTANDADFAGANLSVILSGSLVGNSFELVRYGGTLATPPTVAISLDSGRLTPVVDNGDGTDDAISLSFTGTVADLLWTGANSDLWDDNSSLNFLNGEVEDVFRAFDNVRFDDTSEFNNVFLSGSLRAGTVTFDHSTAAYALEGGGSIAGAASLVKIGSGTLTLNTNNSYSGTTTVNGGTLAINGNQSAANGVISVGGAGSLLTGTGSVGGSITVQNAATFAPGGPATGTFTMGSGAALDMKTGTTLSARIDSAATPALSSKLVLNGNLTIESGVTLDVADLAPTPAALPVDTKLVLIDYGSNTLQGTFSGLSEGSKLTIGPNEFTIRYQDENRVTLTIASDDPYLVWAANPAFGLIAGVNDGFTQDAENDGMSNGLEWILGGNPSIQDASSLVDANHPPAGGLTLEFTREPDSMASADLTVEYDGDLSVPWNSVVIGPGNSGPDANGVIVEINDAVSPHEVKITIPASNEEAGKLFSRLGARPK